MTASQLRHFVQAMLAEWPELVEARPRSYAMQMNEKKFRVWLQSCTRHENGALVYHASIRIGDRGPVENFVAPSMQEAKAAAGAYAFQQYASTDTAPVPT
jgi:hypothetical protein